MKNQPGEKVLIFCYQRGVTTDLHYTEWESAHFSLPTRCHNWPFRYLDFPKVPKKSFFLNVQSSEKCSFQVWDVDVSLSSLPCTQLEQQHCHLLLEGDNNLIYRLFIILFLELLGRGFERNIPITQVNRLRITISNRLGANDIYEEK